jgi:hypothetical protein
LVRCLLALALVFGFTLAAVADVAPPPPTTGLKRVPLETRADTRDEDGRLRVLYV